MNKSTRKQVQEIIDDHFLTDWEFIVNVIAPNIEEEDFDEAEVSAMIGLEIAKRKLKLHQ